MLRTLCHGLYKNINKYLQKTNNVNTTIYQYMPWQSLPYRLLLATPLYCANLKSEERTKIDVENNLKQACEEGDTAIILLMDTLQSFVIAICQEYRTCLTKQIEITQIATSIGPLSEAWDALPHYRTLETDLKHELNEYMTVLNIIGQMTMNNSLEFYVKGNTDNLGLIAIKYKEVNTLLQNEFAQNKEMELELLRLNRESILKSVN